MKNNGVWGGLTKQRAGVRYGVEALFCLDSLFLSHQGERKERRKKHKSGLGSWLRNLRLRNDE
mgnify:CR=1 FL=1